MTATFPSVTTRPLSLSAPLCRWAYPRQAEQGDRTLLMKSVALRLTFVSLRTALGRSQRHRGVPVQLCCCRAFGWLANTSLSVSPGFHFSPSRSCCRGFRGIKPLCTGCQSLTCTSTRHCAFYSTLPHSTTACSHCAAASCHPAPRAWSVFMPPLGGERTQRGDGHLTNPKDHTMTTANQTTSTNGSESCNTMTGRNA
jgi:hypothetical protein